VNKVKLFTNGNDSTINIGMLSELKSHPGSQSFLLIHIYLLSKLQTVH